MTANEDSEQAPLREKLILPEFSKLTIRQLRWIHELRQHGQPAEIVRHYEGITPSMLSRDLAEVSDVLGVSQFYSVENGEMKLTHEAEQIIAAFEPGLDLLDRFDKQRTNPSRIARIGCGGSILAWLINPRASRLREKFSDEGSPASLSCSPLKNRDVVAWVASGALDFGFVRASLLESVRKTTLDKLGQRMIGDVIYGLAVPTAIRDGRDYLRDLLPDQFLTPEVQSEILKREYIATVGPEGEFWMKLSSALSNAGIIPTVEFSYRSFPQTLPHLISGTHVGIVPCPEKWNVRIPNCDIYPLHMLSTYKRRITLIWHNSLAPNWLDPADIANIVEFWTQS